MNSSYWHFRPLQRYLLALTAGVMLAASFPKISLAGTAWLAPGLILFASLGGGRTFRVGYAAGLAFYLATLYWLLLIPMAFVPILGWMLLSAYQALFTALWTWLSWKSCPAQWPPREESMGVLLDRFLAVPWWRRMFWALECAWVWVALEMVQARLFTGFSWTFVGTSQYQVLPLIQISSLTGVYGVSFLVVWFSTSLVGALARIIRQPARYWAWASEPLLAAVGAGAVIAFGASQMLQAAPKRPPLRVALIQPSIPQRVIWDEAESLNRFRELLRLSEAAETAHPDLIVWPEAAVPGLLRYDTNILQAVTGFATRHRQWLILGADDAALRKTKFGTNRVVYFNSSFLINPAGTIVANYRKRKLVIFGEYLPRTPLLGFFKYFTPIDEGFTRGDRPVSFHLSDLHVTTSVLICFEDTFPHVAREYVTPQTDFLLNLTNDGWFGKSAAQWQHAAIAVFRAVENGMPLVRATNNGLTCWVDARGGLHDVYFPGSRNIYRAGIKLARVPLLPPGQTRHLTFYTRHGDWFGWSCVALTSASCLLLFARRFLSKR